MRNKTRGPDTVFDLLTVAEVAKLLHCSKTHVCNVVAGRVNGCTPLPAMRLGRRMLLRRESVLSWIEQNDKITTSPDRARKGA
jgi:excisionase family DNA binding protein